MKTLLGLTALIIFFPLSIHSLDFRARFSHGVSIHLRKTSPAYGALEDASGLFPIRESRTSYRQQVNLSAGKIRLSISMTATKSERLALRSLTIHRTFQPRPDLQAGMNLRMETPDGGLLPMEERKRILMEYFRKENWSNPGVRERAKQLISQEMKVDPVNPDARIIASTVSSTPIIVARPGTDISALLRGTPHPKSFKVASQSADSSTASAPPISTASLWRNRPAAMLAQTSSLTDSGQTNLSVSSLPPAKHDPHLLRGELEIKNGLAFMGSETYFTLQRVSEGAVLESGRVWVSDARFEIYVKEPRGRLVAELHARGGHVLGRGTLDLDGGDPLAESLKIELTPVSPGASVRVASGYSAGPRPILVKNAYVSLDSDSVPRPVNDDGLHVDEDRARASTYVVRAEAKGHWPTLAMGVEGSEQEVRLYPESLVKSLLDLALQGEKRQGAEQYGVVWGRILKDGKPVSGVQVELAGNYSPVYFNQLYIPDNSRSSTDENGTFAFLLVRPGVQAVRVKYNGKVYPAQIFPTEEHHLSYVEIHLEPNRSVNVRLADAFDANKRISAHVRFVGVEDEVVVNDEQKLHYPAGPNIMMLEADAGQDYELSRVQVLKADDLVDVPLIRRDWLQQLVGIKQISLIPERGIVAGFVSDQPFQVSLAGFPAESPQFVYFDARGRLVDGDSGPAGGGFILFNAPLGLQTVLIKPLNSSQVFSQSFVAEPQFVHVFKYSFGGSY